MKILFAIQGTGNGHLSRAKEMIPHIQQHGQLDLLVSGNQNEVQFPYLINYKKQGIGFTFGKKGGIDFIDSIKQLKPFQLLTDIYQLPVENYDLVINDFEPVSAWACKIKKVPCIGLSHQASFLSPKTPRIENSDPISPWILKNYAPTNKHIGFHFQEYDSFIKTPVIRSLVRKNGLSNKEHITVYLPAYSDEIITDVFNKIPDIEWHVFSKHSKKAYYKKNVSIQPIHNLAFIESLCSSNGLITNGGFESPAEAMYLKKKLMVIPMSNQYEQQCNAKAMKLMGITVVNKIDENFYMSLKNWLTYACPVNVNYYDTVAKTIDEIFLDMVPELKLALE